jgi:cytochrome P450
VIKEFDGVLKDRQFESTDVPKLRFTNWVLEEALRLYPPFWMVDRVAIEDDEAAGVAIPAGTTLIAFIYGAHHSPKYWSQPEEFRPERFDGEEHAIRRGFHHLPFGAGPRGCIGANYAKLQMMMILSAFLRQFEFELTGGSDVGTRPMIILRPHGGVWMNVRRKPLT